MSKMTTSLSLPPGVTETHLPIAKNTTIDQWAAIGEALGRVNRASAWWIGDWVNFGENRYGEAYSQYIEATGLDYSTLAAYAHVARQFEFLRRRKTLSFSHHREVASLEPSEQDEWLDRAEAEELGKSDLRRAIRERRVVDAPPPPEGKYRCIVIDPPWPIEKIVREERPKQGPALDYPTMTLEAIGELPIGELADDIGCHIYLWVTHKFLPAGLALLEKWGARYECSLTWVKPVGITPFSWMYNSEHVLFGRIGGLKLEQMGQKLAFEAPVAGHSVKPDEFYERVIAATPGPRLEMFARRPRDGFKVWGNEVANASGS